MEIYPRNKISHPQDFVEDAGKKYIATSVSTLSVFWRTAFTPVIFELCGLLPVFLIALGVLSVSGGIALRNILVFQYYWVFFIAAGGFYVWGLIKFLRARNQCTTEGLKAHKWLIGTSFALLALIEGLVLFINHFLELRLEGNTLIHNYDLVPIIGFPLLFLLVLIIYWRRKYI